MSSAAATEPTSCAARSASARVAELFERHGRMVYGICRAMLRDVHEAEDATQQAFLSAHRALLGGARVRDSGAWIATIARNECRSRIAAGMRTPLAASDEALAAVPHGVDEVERRMQAGALRDALSELPDRQREAVVLRYVCGLRYGEVARALGLSRPATEALLFRARRAMRVRLRHAAGTALVVPLAVREELALAIPGFETQAASGAAAAGVVGGVLAKLASAPATAKLATATVAISTVGAVGVVDGERPTSGVRMEARLSGEPRPQHSVLEPSPVADSGRVDDDAGDDDHGDRGPSRSEGRAGDDRSDNSGEGSSGDDDATESASGRGPDSERSGDHDSGALGSTESGDPGSGEPEPEDRSGSAVSSRSSETTSSSGPGSGEPDTEETEDASVGGSGSSGSGSGDDDSRHSGSDDEPHDDLP